jgi:hypothetical protein
LRIKRNMHSEGLDATRAVCAQTNVGISDKKTK